MGTGGRPSSSLALTGGAEIGLVSASWPLARLVVSPNELTLEVLILGAYAFRSDQVSSLAGYTLIPLVAWGVRVHHVIEEYPKRVIFWSRERPDRVLSKIREIGFVPTARAGAIYGRRGIPLRLGTIGLCLLLWNALFWLDQRSLLAKRGILAVAALIVTFLVSFFTPRWPALQRLFIKHGRDIGEVRHACRFIALITGSIAVAFLVVLLLGGEIGSR